MSFLRAHGAMDGSSKKDGHPTRLGALGGRGLRVRQGP